MKIEFKRISLSDHKVWDDYVSKSNHSTPFHMIRWKEIIENEYGFEPMYYLVFINSRLSGILPMFFIRNIRGKKLVSMPVSAYGGPILSDTNILPYLIDFVNSLETDYYIYTKYIPDKCVKCFYSHDSTDYKLNPDLKKKFKSAALKSGSIKNSITRCLNKQVEFKLTGIEEIENFYSLFLQTRKRQKSLIPSKSYIETILKSEMEFQFFTVHHNNRIQSCVMGVLFNNKFYSIYNANGNESVKLRSNDFLHYKIIDWCMERGYDFYFGGTVNDDSFSGLHNFKIKWGSSAEKIYLLSNKEKYYVNNFKSNGIGILKYIPDFIYTRIGKYAVKYFY